MINSTTHNQDLTTFHFCQFIINNKVALPGMLIKFKTSEMKDARVRQIKEVDGASETIVVRYGQYKKIKLERKDIIEIY